MPHSRRDRRLALAAVALPLLFAGYQWATWPDVARLAKEEPRSTAFLDAWSA
jgi:hypothetical protein